MVLKENAGIPAHLLWTLAVIAGVSVANLYYNQPLLDLMRLDFGVSEFQANLIAMITQVGYALGLLFIIPLGDLFERRHIVVVNFSILVVALLAMGLSASLPALLGASLLTGICSVMPQIFIPIAAQCSRPEHKARNMGMLVSGLLMGILSSRVVSGLVGEYYGWRTMYFVAAGLMGVSALFVGRFLPDTTVSFRGIYAIRLADDGLAVAEGSKPQRVAGTAFEGTYIHRHDGKYYLFASVGSCCEGAKSTYQLVVGRADSLFGPYVDKSGKSMMDNGYEVVIGKSDRFVGNGHCSEIVQDGAGNDWILYHGVDLQRPEGRMLFLDRVLWDEAGWPYVAGGTPSLEAEAPEF